MTLELVHGNKNALLLTGWHTQCANVILQAEYRATTALALLGVRVNNTLCVFVVKDVVDSNVHTKRTSCRVEHVGDGQRSLLRLVKGQHVHQNGFPRSKRTGALTL
jgi:hypothetical protein